jgi:hypothetical protein
MRVDGVAPDDVDDAIRAVFEAQARKWGAPLLNHTVYARRPSIFHGARAMWSGLDRSGLIDGAVSSLVNVRVAALNGCVF